MEREDGELTKKVRLLEGKSEDSGPGDSVRNSSLISALTGIRGPWRDETLAGKESRETWQL